MVLRGRRHVSCFVSRARCAAAAARGLEKGGDTTMSHAIDGGSSAVPEIGSHPEAQPVSGERAVYGRRQPADDERPLERPRRRWSREGIAKLLADSGWREHVVAARRQLGLPWLTVLTYHRIGAPGSAGDLDGDTIDATPAQFEEQIAHLASRYSFVSIDAVIEHLSGGSLPPNPVLVTFDDGYLECIEQALPILTRYRARATFFIASDFIDRREIMWWDKLSLILRRSRRPRIELDYPFPMSLDLARPEVAHRHLVAVVKTHYALDLPHFVRTVERAAGVVLERGEERALADDTLMTWDHVAALAEAGMDVGSHTCSHRVLQTLSPGQLARELEGSRRVIERNVKRAVGAIAYPVGYPLEGARRIRAALRDARYRAGFSNNTGFNSPFGHGDRFDVRRVGMSRSFDEDYFRAFMALPPLARARRRPPSIPAL